MKQMTVFTNLEKHEHKSFNTFIIFSTFTMLCAHFNLLNICYFLLILKMLFNQRSTSRSPAFKIFLTANIRYSGCTVIYTCNKEQGQCSQQHTHVVYTCMVMHYLFHIQVLMIVHTLRCIHSWYEINKQYYKKKHSKFEVQRSVKDT